LTTTKKTAQERVAQFEASFSAALDALLARPGEPVPGVHPPGPANAASLCFARCVFGSCQLAQQSSVSLSISRARLSPLTRPQKKQRRTHTKPTNQPTKKNRDACLAAAGFGDVFAAVKAAENAKALALLPGVLAELDAIDGDGARLEAALRGVFAGAWRCVCGGGVL
jgi:hypothetical protein